jgi:hypothetical protein
MRYIPAAIAALVFCLLAKEVFSAEFVSADWETRTTIILIVGGAGCIVVDSVNTIRKGKQ